MLKKRQLIMMLLLLTCACGLYGCSEPNPVQANTPTAPAVSAAATPTSAENAPSSENTPTIPAVTDTPAPTATPTPSPTPTPIPTVPPAPAALNVDTVNTYDFLVNRDYPLTSSYRPSDLVVPDIKFSFSEKNIDKRKLRKVAADALTELCAAALAEDGLTIYGVSGYRSYDRQYDIYGAKLIERGTRVANLYSAAPGNSEHQSGLAIDVSSRSIGYSLDDRFATTAEGIWLKENGWRFGFILRYPKDKEHITGYAYEPWHIRYVGVPLAYYLHTTGLTLEEYYGSPSSHTLEELATLPLIDMTTNRFYKLYAATLKAELCYKADGSVLVSEATQLPLLKGIIVDAEGNPILLNNATIPVEPVYDAEGNPMQDADGNLYYTKPYFDADGNLWLDYNNSPVYLQPLWNADHTPATDADGNLYYTEPLTSPSGMEIITETGSLIQKVPMRDEYGELIFNPDGSAVFYEPFINPVTLEFITDSVSGEPLYPSEYYRVPHNTLPLTPKPEAVVPEEEDNFYYDYDVEEDYYDITEETGGFFE